MWKGTRLPDPTSGPGEPELNRVFNVRWPFFATQANETDTVVDTLSTVSMANVQGHSVPFDVKKQPIQIAVSRLIPEAE